MTTQSRPSVDASGKANGTSKTPFAPPSIEDDSFRFPASSLQKVLVACEASKQKLSHLTETAFYSRIFSDLTSIDCYPKLESFLYNVWFYEVPKNIESKVAQSAHYGIQAAYMSLTLADYIAADRGNKRKDWLLLLKWCGKSLYDKNDKTGLSYVEEIFNQVKSKDDTFENYEESIVCAYLASYMSTVLDERMNSLPEHLQSINIRFVKVLEDDIMDSVVKPLVSEQRQNRQQAEWRAKQRKIRGFLAKYVERIVASNEDKIASYLAKADSSNTEDIQRYLRTIHRSYEVKINPAVRIAFEGFKEEFFGEKNHKLYSNILESLKDEIQPLSIEEKSYLLSKIYISCQEALLDSYASKIFGDNYNTNWAARKLFLAQLSGEEFIAVEAEQRKIFGLIGDLEKLASQLQDTASKNKVMDCANNIKCKCKRLYEHKRYLSSEEKTEFTSYIREQGNIAFSTIQQTEVPKTIVERFISLLSKLLNPFTKLTSKPRKELKADGGLDAGVPSKSSSTSYFYRANVVPLAKRMEQVIDNIKPSHTEKPANPPRYVNS